MTKEQPTINTDLLFDTVNAHKRIICAFCHKRFFSDMTNPEAMGKDLCQKLVLHLQNKHASELTQHKEAIKRIGEMLSQYLFLTGLAIVDSNVVLEEFLDDVEEALLEVMGVDIEDADEEKEENDELDPDEYKPYGDSPFGEVTEVIDEKET